jgi:predicted helicase
LIDRWHQFAQILPTPEAEQENQVIWLKTGSGWPAFALMTNCIVDSLPQGGSQCFPFYAYDPDGTNRRENITDWALGKFRAQYGDDAISKWDIFYYIYGLLHHPSYRQRYAEILKRELPRIPFAPDFRTSADAGRKLAELHLNYEEASPHRFQWIMDGTQAISYLVHRMLLQDKIPVGEGRAYSAYDSLVVNRLLTLIGIPPEAFGYRLGNRSALEWVIDQYRVRKDRYSGIAYNPNTYARHREKGERYIIRLVGQVVAVSVETVQIVDSLTEQPFAQPEATG